MEWTIALLFGPPWFYKEALIIQGISVLAILLVALASHKYRAHSSHQGKFGVLERALLIVAAALFLRIILDASIYFELAETVHPGFATFPSIFSDEAFLFIGVLLYRLLILLGFGTLYTLYEPQKKRNLLLGAAFLVVVTFASIAHVYWFHIVALLLLAATVTAHFNRVRKRNTAPARFVLTSYLLLALSQVLFIFKTHELFYLLGIAVQFAGFGGLVLTLYAIQRHGKIQVTR